MNLTIAKRVLGVASIGLGLVAVAAPRRVSDALGLDVEDGSVSAFGARGVGSGTGLLAPVRPGPLFWLRVGSDVMGLAALGKALRRGDRPRPLVIAVAGAVAAISLLEILVAIEALRDERRGLA